MPRTVARITVDEFLRRIEDGRKADLLDGVIHMASPDSPRANQVALFVAGLLDVYTDTRGLGKVYTQRSAFRLAEYYAPEPDVAFVKKERLHLWERGSIFLGPPDVAVEVVAPESAERDRGLKLAAYERAGVGEYWLIDLPANRCRFLVLAEGSFREASLVNGRIFRSSVVEGFWLDSGWLLAAELPHRIDCQRQVLAK